MKNLFKMLRFAMKKQTIYTILAILLMAVSSRIFAQSAPLSDTLQINSIRARVQSNGQINS